jgi:hypothetical protein
MSSLRNEIIESHKVRSELLKWKLIIVSALGAAGLGFTEHGGTRGAYLVLLLIPLVCFYVDLVYRHVALRILLIGKFIGLGFCGVETAYEHFVAKATRMGPEKNLNVFGLEHWALGWSTGILSLLVILAGFIVPDMMCCVRVFFFLSGLIGIILSEWGRRCYRRRVDAVIDLANDKELVEKLRSMAREAVV